MIGGGSVGAFTANVISKYPEKLWKFSPVQNSAKQFLIETEDDADAMKSDKMSSACDEAEKSGRKS